jgi:hypothetical protein
LEVSGSKAIIHVNIKFWLSGQVLKVSGSKAIVQVCTIALEPETSKTCPLSQNFKFTCTIALEPETFKTCPLSQKEVSGSKAIVQVNLNFWLSGQVLEISGSKAIVQVNLKF